MNFIIFNTILFIVSYMIDYIAINWFGIKEWSEPYLYYLVCINIPISSFIAYKINKEIKNK